MRRLPWFSRTTILALAFVSLAACATSQSLQAVGLALPPPFPSASPVKKIFVVVLENADGKKALKQPFLRYLADNGALLTRFSFAGRPSQPNYLALTSGSTHGVQSNDPVTLDVRHLGNLLEERGLTWKSYAEDYPGNCFLKKEKGLYVRKHEPFLTYRNVQSDPARCLRVVNATVLEADIKAHTLPDFSLFIPNNENNGHSPKDVKFANDWLERTFAKRLKDSDFMAGLLFVVTFDESSHSHTAPIYTVLYGNSVKPGSTSDSPYDHYSLLRTIEEAFGLPNLGQEDAKAVPIGGVWK